MYYYDSAQTYYHWVKGGEQDEDDRCERDRRADGVSKATAYKIIRQINAELQANGCRTVQGRVSREYFERVCFSMPDSKKGDDWHGRERDSAYAAYSVLASMCFCCFRQYLLTVAPPRIYRISQCEHVVFDVWGRLANWVGAHLRGELGRFVAEGFALASLALGTRCGSLSSELSVEAYGVAVLPMGPFRMRRGAALGRYGSFRDICC